MVGETRVDTRMFHTERTVRVDEAAAQAGTSWQEAADIVRSWPAVFVDDIGRIARFWGLALNEMPHRL